jgi:hypothetical protein
MKYKVGLILAILGLNTNSLFSKDNLEFFQKNKMSSSMPKLCLKYKKDSGMLYEFDIQGRVVSRSIDRNEDWKADSRDFFTYDGNGNVIKIITEVYQKPTLAKTNSSVTPVVYSYEKMRDIPTEIGKIVTKRYDEKNRLITEIVDTPEHLLSGEERRYRFRKGYRYNNKGDVVNEIKYLNGDLMVEYKVLNSYDERGNLIHTQYRSVKIGEIPFIETGHTEKSYWYNEKNQLIQMLDHGYRQLHKYRYNKFGKLEEEKIYRTKYKSMEIKQPAGDIIYKYDKYGNLVEKRDIGYFVSIGYDKHGNLIEKRDTSRLILEQRFGICGE